MKGSPIEPCVPENNSATLIPASRVGSTPIPTCPPGKVGRESGCGLLYGTTKRHSVDPPTKEGFLFSESTLAPGLVQAYRETEYRVFGTDPFVITVGVASSELLALYHGHKVTCAAFITACNPLGQELPAHENQRRQDELAKELNQRGLEYLVGVGQHPTGGWPGEPSFLILGLELEAAKCLGGSLEQNAIVWCGADCVPELVLLR